MTDQGTLWPVPARPSSHRVRRGLDQTVRCLTDAGRLEPVDAARVALARRVADELDAAFADPDESRYTKFTGARTYHVILDGVFDRPDRTLAADLDAMLAAALTDDHTHPSSPGSSDTSQP